jgi:hypothetical protein
LGGMIAGKNDYEGGGWHIARRQNDSPLFFKESGNGKKVRFLVDRKKYCNKKLNFDGTKASLHLCNVLESRNLLNVTLSTQSPKRAHFSLRNDRLQSQQVG